MSTTTATIETLTAEVRTLVVGSRQITLSVAKQLDVIPLADIRIMGRVRALKDEDHVIGVGPDGTLALARYWPHRIEYPTVRRSDLLTPVGMCVPGPKRYSPRLVDFEGVTVDFEWDAVNFCPSGHRTPCAIRISATQAAAVQLVIERETDAVALRNGLNAAASCAPLIVLAGLR